VIAEPERGTLAPLSEKYQITRLYGKAAAGCDQQLQKCAAPGVEPLRCNLWRNRQVVLMYTSKGSSQGQPGKMQEKVLSLGQERLSSNSK